ncbi:16S rRNA (uracil(1498)-N(3))-methyltransferase [Virgibacillus dakarensis]|uniref:Ribosomal RNA small subunit methyltransferase E n=1 Tax=Lentibacillus populi TaxID=1827502 RepID=A0A9W5TUQ1_9BACI|nr:16S rRNA (uracil(1498)-N(3))-methyltransferase [Lentibacillus populi]MTW84115.1 16S rRNA (uracil(1498)-N(3))-methyltransferase [Virgibacillus dakarensis]GGB29005.1 ribosomal RNA small subunit methyltransferase E [Lentibacillus populi]
MQRYFIPAENWAADTVSIFGDDVHHMTRVMRFKEGDKVICNRPDGKAAICVIRTLDPDHISAAIVEWLNETVELPVNVTIAQGLPKGDKIDFVLQKGTELGAAGFIPFQSERSIVVWDKKKTEKKLNRFAKLVKEASEQSHRNKIPVIHPLVNMDGLIRESNNYNMLLFAYEEEAKVTAYQSFAKAVKSLGRNQNVLVCIGPEGGFSANEAETLKANGFSPVRLGPRILRTETASLYVLASISYHLEELGCE